jgi:hypothetical protein
MKKEKLLMNDPNIKVWKTEKGNVLKVYAERGCLSITSLQNEMRKNDTFPTWDLNYEDIDLSNVKFIFVTIFGTRQGDNFFHDCGIYRISRTSIIKLTK